MSRFNAFALCVFTMAMTLLACALSIQGLAYIDVGIGLHPALAFPLATLAIIVLFPTWVVMLNHMEYAVVGKASDLYYRAARADRQATV